MGKRDKGQIPDSPEYLARKAYFDSFLTIYGRKTVLDALENPQVLVERLHVAENWQGETMSRILELASQRGVEPRFSPQEKITRISRNGRQDQGVVADIKAAGYQQLADFLANAPAAFALLALDNVTTPENVGMIIRSAAAGGLDGIVLPDRGCASLGPLVIKASAGTVFRTKILRCATAASGLELLAGAGASIYALDAAGEASLFAHQSPARAVYLMGGEAAGPGREAANFCIQRLSIPMSNGVESLNVAVSAALVAYRRHLTGQKQ